MIDIASLVSINHIKILDKISITIRRKKKDNKKKQNKKKTHTQKKNM